jgi:DNA helicase HerA-like ATPase
VHLLRRKKTARSPLMVVYEECQDFVPQRVAPDSARMVGALERLIKQGRNFGVGTTLISQSPQAVNKDVLNQTECLIVLQIDGAPRAQGHPRVGR